MTVYMLDTNTVIALLNSTKPTVAARASEAIGRGVTLQISSIVAHELWYGVYKSVQQSRNAAALESRAIAYDRAI